MIFGQFYSWYLFRVIAPLLLYCIWIEFKYRVKLYSIPPPFDMPHPGNRIRHLFCPSQRLSIKMHSKIYTQCNWFYFTHLFPTFFCTPFYIYIFIHQQYLLLSILAKKKCVKLWKNIFPAEKKHKFPFIVTNSFISSCIASFCIKCDADL